MVRTSRRRGFTLIELIVSVGVLCAVATAMAWVGPAQLRGIVRSHEESVALRAATAHLERLRDGRAARLRTETFVLDGAGADLPRGAGAQTVTPAGPGLVHVEVRITWDAADRGEGHVQLATLVAAEPAR